MRLDDPAVAVHDDGPLGRNRFAEARDADDGRKAERAGDDRCVGRRAAPLERQGAHAAGIQARSLDRGQLVGHEDRAARQLPRSRTLPVGEVGRDLARDVRDVRLAFPQRRGVGGREARPELPRHFGQRPLGVDPVAPDALDDAAEIGLVERDQAVRLEDRGELRAHVALGLTGVAHELLGRAGGGTAQAPLLLLELLGADRAAKRREPAEPDDHGPADGEARRNGEALEHL